MAAIFTGWQKVKKRGNYGLFCSPNAFNNDFNNSTRLKGCLSWNSPQSPRAKWSFEAEIFPYVVVLPQKRTVTPPLYLCFLLVMATPKNILRRKNQYSRSCIFLDVNNVNSRIWSRATEERDNKEFKIPRRRRPRKRLVNSLALSNSSELSWSRIPNKHIHVQRERKKISSTLVYVLHKTWY